jgi:hypothetical protein
MVILASVINMYLQFDGQYSKNNKNFTDKI